jgi:hypothetical protein
MAPSPTIPTTTPAAIPAVLGLLSSLGGSIDCVEVGAATGAAEVGVADDGFADEELDDRGSNCSTLFRVMPVSATHNRLGPPPASC